MSELIKEQDIQFFDPFLEDNQEIDLVASHIKASELYLSNSVEHDYSADRFVSDSQALLMDAKFLGKMEAAQDIVARMHQLCGEDHNLSQSMQGNDAFKSLFEDSHQHDHNSLDNKYDHEKEDDIDPKTGKKRTQKTLKTRGVSLFELISRSNKESSQGFSLFRFN